MQWWDDLWLNEAFATWIEFRTVADWRPDWDIWVDFQQEKAAPFNTDALASTRPIHAPVKSAAQASEMFDAITYEKGAAVLFMLEQYVGPSVFRAGVRQYIRDHREGNATANDLFGALGKPPAPASAPSPATGSISPASRSSAPRLARAVPAPTCCSNSSGSSPTQHWTVAGSLHATAVRPPSPQTRPAGESRSSCASRTAGAPPYSAHSCPRRAPR